MEYYGSETQSGTVDDTKIEGVNASAEDEQHWYSYASQLVSSAVLPMVMHAILELDVLEIIAKAGPGAQLHPSEIASQMPTSNPEAPAMLDRMLRLLASHSVVTCSVEIQDAATAGTRAINGDHRARRTMYGLGPVAKYFVRNQDGVSLRQVMPMVLDKVFMACWYELKDAVLEGGIPFNRAHGTHIFEYAGKDRGFNEVFNKAMAATTSVIVRRILEVYKGFEHLQQVVDIGGGLGFSLNLITSKYPHIRGINFDLPHVVQHAPPYPGVEHVGGDMFESVPKGDAIFMKWILHDWSDDQCLKLLRNCHEALPEKGKVIVVEALLPEKPDEDTNDAAAARLLCQCDLIMMTYNPGGKERTHLEYQALATRAGFTEITLECYAGNLWVIEFHK